ncbi:Cysteine-rich membrane protein 1 [Spironucleus salmonicida]|uniref:Cysteine-rich membrane protein 1 n=1 Tax=Spironucleus salmonicida TaxID=348837 RepID=V6LD57_9EUKA|nr:Cysteine-rich membrane protein 1 [Spironucleus salmonicida]|eukprot:EST42435.1 Cysteine-rich membrane protein 1 [Spironucleus salmonicida]
MSDAGKCSRSSTGCKAGFYCPATSITEVICLPCSGDIKLGQGCYCVDNTANPNCRECADKKCSQCIPGSFLENDMCTSCLKGCAKCKNPDSCEACAEGYIKENDTCVRVCNSLKDCEDEISTFCNLSVNRCEKCEQNCLLCSSKTVCNTCNPGAYTTTIDGRCIANCNSLQDGEYCKNGVATSCAKGLDSACKCGNAVNCASCNDNKTDCDTCLPNIVKAKGGTCTECTDGYEVRGRLCWPKQDTVQQNKIGGGAIAGIIIGVLVVAGAVGGGLAYYFIKKARK